MTVIKELNRMYGEYNYRCRLQDVSDEEFKRIYTTIKPQSWFDIQDYLEEHTEDREVLAHLKGFESAKERDEMVAHNPLWRCRYTAICENAIDLYKAEKRKAND